jgi:hypothetical protein
MKPDQVRRAYRVEWQRDGNLAVHKDAASPNEAGRIILIWLFPAAIGVSMLLAPLLPDPSLGSRQTAVSVPVGVSLLVLGSALAWALNRRVRRGVWHIDGRGVAFLPRSGPESRVDWKDVQWVRWRQQQVVLLGDRGRVALEQGDLSSDDWLMVRGRVEAMLSGRFDLTSKPAPMPVPEPVASLTRTLGLAGILLGILAASLLTHQVTRPPVWLAVSLIAFLIPMAGVGMLTVIVLLLAFMSQARDCLDLTWRAAKSKGLEWDGW